MDRISEEFNGASQRWSAASTCQSGHSDTSSARGRDSATSIDDNASEEPINRGRSSEEPSQTTVFKRVKLSAETEAKLRLKALLQRALIDEKIAHDSTAQHSESHRSSNESSDSSKRSRFFRVRACNLQRDPTTEVSQAPERSRPVERSWFPTTFVDIETGDRIVDVRTNPFYEPKRFRRMNADGTVAPPPPSGPHGATPEVSDSESDAGSQPEGPAANGLPRESRQSRARLRQCPRPIRPEAYTHEVGGLAYAWRWCLELLLLATADEVNGLRLTRGLQLELHFLTSSESYLLDRLIDAFERGTRSRAPAPRVASSAHVPQRFARVSSHRLRRLDGRSGPDATDGVS